MSHSVFAFWEGNSMPDYLKMCMETWKFPYVMLNFDNLNEYTDLDIGKLKRFTLAQISDCVRAHVLRDNGGHWIDIDTIMIANKLPEKNVLGYPENRHHSVSIVYAEDPDDPFFTRWAAYQDDILNSSETPEEWSTFCNDFTDDYVKAHKEITMYDIYKCRPELKMVEDTYKHHMFKYQQMYFFRSYYLSDLKPEPTDMLALHHSWTPDWYKGLTRNEILQHNCTLSNIFREVL